MRKRSKRYGRKRVFGPYRASSRSRPRCCSAIDDEQRHAVIPLLCVIDTQRRNCSSLMQCVVRIKKVVRNGDIAATQQQQQQQQQRPLELHRTTAADAAAAAGTMGR